jgi:hypothetical protein
MTHSSAFSLFIFCRLIPGDGEKITKSQAQLAEGKGHQQQGRMNFALLHSTQLFFVIFTTSLVLFCFPPPDSLLSPIHFCLLSIFFISKMLMGKGEMLFMEGKQL